MLTSMSINVFAVDETFTFEELKYDTDILHEICSSIYKTGYMRRFCDSYQSSAFDSIYFMSNEGFFLYIYELIYDDSDEWLVEGQSAEGYDEVYYDTCEERKLRINRLLDDGYISQEDVETVSTNKEVIATVLYRIYGPVVPFKNTIEFTDTDNIALEWAKEIGLPYYDYENGHPQFILHLAEYTAIIAYAYLYLPINDDYEYNDINDYVDISAHQIVEDIRESILAIEEIEVIEEIEIEIDQEENNNKIENNQVEVESTFPIRYVIIVGCIVVLLSLLFIQNKWYKKE